jgi:hypothetical protein
MAIPVKTLSVDHLAFPGRLPDPPQVPGMTPAQLGALNTWWSLARHKLQTDSQELNATIEDIYRRLGGSTTVNEGDTITNISTVQSGYYYHEQNVASNQWVVKHNLGVRPVVSLLTDGYQEMVASVTHTDENTVVIDFNFDASGKAICT